MQKPIRILHITGGMNRGGAETMIMNIYREIDKTNIQFDFISYYDKPGDYDEEIVGLGGRNFNIKSPKKIGFFKYLNALKKINKEYGPYYAIHSHTLLNSGISLLCAKILKIPVRICHAHSTANAKNKSIKFKIYEKFMKNLINFSSTKKIACGIKAGEYLYGRKFSVKGKVLSNAISKEYCLDIDLEKINNVKKQFECQTQEIIIGHVGSFRMAKNHEFMVELAKSMKQSGLIFKLIFVGNGLLQEKIKQKVVLNNLEDCICFAGLRKDIPILMKMFDVLIMPSLYEGFPVTLVESQASNICAVISDNISEEVDLGLGLIYRLSLKDSFDVWQSEILKSVKFKNCVSKNHLIKTISDKGYFVENSIKQLLEIYGIKE